MAAVVNLSAYKFAPLADLPALQDRLKAVADAGALKGTILLSPEGINLFVAGERAALDTLLAEIRAVPGLADLTPKESLSAAQPFHRMLVKIKKEIIAFGVAGIDPARRPTAKLPARTLRQWLDEGRPVTLLDTRNDYEVSVGTFRGAVPAGIRHFRDFPRAVEKLPATLKEQPIVMFCTGGIRCEKASSYLLSQGFEEVYHLKGGILKYLEEVPEEKSTWEGECYVFDNRVAVDTISPPAPMNCVMPVAVRSRHKRKPHHTIVTV